MSNDYGREATKEQEYLREENNHFEGDKFVGFALVQCMTGSNVCRLGNFRHMNHFSMF